MTSQILKNSSIEIYGRNGHKNTQPFRNLVVTATDSLSSLISFSNCDNTTVDFIIVKYEATNRTSGIDKYGSGTDIDS